MTGTIGQLSMTELITMLRPEFHVPDVDAGVPAYNATEGTLYWDRTNDVLYVNNNGAAGWTAAAGGILGGGLATEVAYWTAPNTIAGDAGFTFNAATDSFSLAGGMILTGGANAVITVNDNVANALTLVDAGATEYLRIISTNAQPITRFNDGGADIDFYVEAVAVPDALFIRGSDGQITLGVLGAGVLNSTAGGVISSGTHNHSTAATGGGLAIGITDTDATPGSVFFAGALGVIQQDNANFFFDDTNNRLGIGVNPGEALLYVRDIAFNTTATSYSLWLNRIKTAGVTGAGDFLYGILNTMEFNQGGANLDTMYGIDSLANLAAGTVNIDMYGERIQVRLLGGTVTNDVIGSEIFANLDTGIAGNDVYGLIVDVDIQGTMTSVAGDVYGVFVQVDDDQTAGGTVYMHYLNALTHIDFGYYQTSTSGTVVNYFADFVGVGTSLAGWSVTAGKASIREDIDYSAIPTEFEDHAHLLIWNDQNADAGSKAVILFHTDTAGGSSMRAGIAGSNDGSNSRLEFYGSIANKDPTDTPDVTILASGNVGIGTVTIPHAAIGVAKFAIEGTDASTAGPHAQFTTAADNYPLLAFVPWQHDRISILFDSYYDGAAYRSSDAGSSCRVAKASDLYAIQWDVVAAGGAITWNTAFVIDLTNGQVGINDLSPDAMLDVIALDAATNTTTDVIILEHTTSGTAAADFGAGILYQLEDAGGTVRDAVRLAGVWTSAAAAEQAEFQLWLTYNAVLYDCGVIVAPAAASVVGNQRGDAAADWQGARNNATEVASGDYSVLSGGAANTSSNTYSTVSGGANNIASNTHTVVGGGGTNEANAIYACIPGGFSNLASGNYSHAAGYDAHATHTNSIVFSASAAQTLSWAVNTWTVRCHGGARFYSAAGVGTGVQLAAGGAAWAAISDIALKENIEPATGILSKLDSIAIYNYNLKSQPANIRHIGPVAQEFNPAFGFTEDAVRINMMDIAGVTLGAVKELMEENKALRKRISALECWN